MKEIFQKLFITEKTPQSLLKYFIDNIDCHPSFIDDLFQRLIQDNEFIKIRAAEILEKISNAHPELIQPYKHLILTRVCSIPHNEIRLRIVQIIPNLFLNNQEKSVAVQILKKYLQDLDSNTKTDSVLIDKMLRNKTITTLENLEGIRYLDHPKYHNQAS